MEMASRRPLSPADLLGIRSSRDHDGRDRVRPARLRVETCAAFGFRPGFRRVNADVQFHEERADFSDRRQGQLFDVIGLCATMNDEPVLEDVDANARDTTVRSLVNPAFENACDCLAIFSRSMIRLHAVPPCGSDPPDLRLEMPSLLQPGAEQRSDGCRRASARDRLTGSYGPLPSEWRQA
jgi:hypothetical protein